MCNAWGRGVSALAAVVLAACGGGGDGGTDAPDSAPTTTQKYYPLPANARWLYQADDGRVVQVDATGTAPTAQGTGTLLRTSNDGLWIDTDLVVATERDVTLYPSPTGDSIEREGGPMQLLSFPARPGQTYTQIDKSFQSSVDFDGDGIGDQVVEKSIGLVVGYEDIDTPAGHFAGTLHLRSDLRQTIVRSASSTSSVYHVVVDEWYAPDIGLARRSQARYFDGNDIPFVFAQSLAGYSVAGLRSDTTAPSVVSTTPSAGRAATAVVAATFSEAIDPTTLAAGWRVLGPNGSALAGQVRITGNTAHFVPDAGWQNGSYTATLTTAVTDLLGNPLAQDVSWHFTLDGAAPAVIAVTPADKASNVLSTTPLVIQFSEPIDPASVSFSSIRLDGGAGVALTPTVSGATLTLTPAAPWPKRATIQVGLNSVTDLAGNPMASGFTTSFRSDAGEFDYPQDLVPAGSARSMVVVDLDGDGFQDFVYTPSALDAVSVSVRYGRAGGTLADAVPLVPGDVPACGSSTGLNVLDLDGDGRRDLVLGDAWCGWRVIRQVAPRSFAVAETLRYVTVGLLRVADLDGDGVPELVGLEKSVGGMQLFVWKQDGTRRFVTTPSQVLLPLAAGDALSIADLDGDGRADLLVGGSSPGALALLRQRGDGTFEPAQVLTTGEKVLGSVAVGDVDGDGRPDIVVAAGGNSPAWVSVFHQQLDRSFGAPQQLPTLDLPSAVVLADLDGDGRLDIAVSHPGWFQVSTYLQRADGTLGAENRYPTSYSGGTEGALAVGDLSGDGRADLVIGGQLMQQRTPESAPSGVLRRPGARP